jgi:transcriptional regulator with XRE-family HTH domain
VPGANAERALRVKVIRDALGMTQPEFAAKLNAAALELGLEARYTQLNVSQRETDRLALDIEDYVILAHVDPHHRSILWLAFGREVPVKFLGMLPKPERTKEAPGDAGQGDSPRKRHHSK